MISSIALGNAKLIATGATAEIYAWCTGRVLAQETQKPETSGFPAENFILITRIIFRS